MKRTHSWLDDSHDGDGDGYRHFHYDMYPLLGKLTQGGAEVQNNFVKIIRDYDYIFMGSCN